MKEVNSISILLLSIGIGLLVISPSLMGYLSSTPQKQFQGFTFVEDVHAYAAYVNSGVREDILLLKNYSTSEPQEGRYVILYYSLLAFVTRITSIPIDVVWTFFNALVVTVFLLVSWVFIRFLFNEEKTALMAWILLALGGGLGGFIYLLSFILPWFGRLYSHDLTYPLGYSFIGFAYHALAIFSYIFAIGAIYFWLKYFENKKGKYALTSSACLTIAFFNHPTSAIIATLAAGIFLLHHYAWGYLQKKRWDILPAFVLIIPGALALIYTWWANQDPVFAFHQQYYLVNNFWNVIQPPWFFPMGFGLLLVLGAIGLFSNPYFRNSSTRLMMGAWLVIAILASQLFPAGVKYLYLIHLPLVAFASIGIVEAVKTLSVRFSLSSRHWYAIIILVLCISAPLVIAKRAQEVMGEEKHYISLAERMTFDFLETQEDGVLLSGMKFGSNLSWKGKQRPFLAHGLLTIDFQTKQEEVRAFFSVDTPLSEKKRILSENNITHVYHGEEESKMGMVSSELNLIPIFSLNEGTLFHVPTE